MYANPGDPSSVGVMNKPIAKRGEDDPQPAGRLTSEQPPSQTARPAGDEPESEAESKQSELAPGWEPA